MFSLCCSSGRNTHCPEHAEAMSNGLAWPGQARPSSCSACAPPSYVRIESHVADVSKQDIPLFLLIDLLWASSSAPRNFPRQSC